MRKLPPLRALQCFEQAADHLSFSRAAEAIGMTHGAISHQIRQLEDWLGVRLFERHPGGVRLTEHGGRLRQASTLALSVIEDECERLRQCSRAPAITVGCSATFLVQWLLPRAEAFCRSGDPQLSFQTRADLSALLSRKIDMLIVSAAEGPPAGLDGIRLAADRIGPICAVGWQPRPETASEIGALRLLHAASRPEAWSEWAEMAGVELCYDFGHRFETLTLAIEAARGGLGLAMTPELLVRSDLARGRLIAPLGFVEAKRSTWAYFRRSAALDPKIKRFVDWLGAEAMGNP